MGAEGFGNAIPPNLSGDVSTDQRMCVNLFVLYLPRPRGEMIGVYEGGESRREGCSTPSRLLVSPQNPCQPSRDLYQLFCGHQGALFGDGFSQTSVCVWAVTIRVQSECLMGRTTVVFGNLQHLATGQSGKMCFPSVSLTFRAARGLKNSGQTLPFLSLKIRVWWGKKEDWRS